MNTYLISFDDTDNLQTLGTGHVLARFLDDLPCETGFITRHQLFVNKNVPFTSHNSAMCATVRGDIAYEELIRRAALFLKRAHAEESDPGLCVADLDGLSNAALLVEWGVRAKTEVLAKGDAYELARRCSVHLSEHGGDGQGVVGALAGVGLRLSGNDGRVRGKASVDAGRLTVRELLDCTGFERVCAYGEGPLDDGCLIEVEGNEVKAIYQNHERTVLVTRAGSAYAPLGKQHLKLY